jgi:endonuclease G
VSVFTGPIYRPDDRVYRNVAIPRDFWKILIWVDEEKGPRASAFLMTQDDLIRQIEAFGLEKFKVYQVSIGEVARRTGLRFGNLDRYDTRPAAGPEALTATAGATATLVESFTDLQL